MGSWLKLVASQKNLPRSLILVELRLKGGIPMISELGIAPGPAGEFAAPHLEEGSTDSEREMRVPETRQRYWDSFSFKELLRNRISTFSTPLPQAVTCLCRCLGLCG